MKKLVWNVIVEDSNSREITIYNVFDHGGFITDIQHHFRKCKTKAEFAEKLRRSVKYYFRSKSQWEVIIRPLFEGQKPFEKKIDVSWQILNNWDVFLDYVWNAGLKRNTNSGTQIAGGINARMQNGI